MIMKTKQTFMRCVVLVCALCLFTAVLSVGAPLRMARADQESVGSITLSLRNRSNDVALTSGVISLYRVATVDRSGAPRYDVSGGQFADSETAAIIPDLTQDELDEQNESLTNELIRYAISHDIDPIASRNVTTDSLVRFTDLEEGLFLVRQTRLSQDRLTMNPFLMSVPFEGQMDVVAYPKPGNDKTDPIHPGDEDYEEPGDQEDPENPDNPDDPDDHGEPDDPTNPVDEPGNPDGSDEPDVPSNPSSPGDDGATPSNPSTTTTDNDNSTRTSSSTIVGSQAASQQSGSATSGGHVPQTGDALSSIGMIVAGVAGLLTVFCGVALRRCKGVEA